MDSPNGTPAKRRTVSVNQSDTKLLRQAIAYRHQLGISWVPVCARYHGNRNSLRRVERAFENNNFRYMTSETRDVMRRFVIDYESGQWGNQAPGDPGPSRFPTLTESLVGQEVVTKLVTPKPQRLPKGGNVTGFRMTLEFDLDLHKSMQLLQWLATNDFRYRLVEAETNVSPIKGS